jgi:hypothetical protein
MVVSSQNGTKSSGPPRADLPHSSRASCCCASPSHVSGVSLFSGLSFLIQTSRAHLLRFTRGMRKILSATKHSFHTHCCVAKFYFECQNQNIISFLKQILIFPQINCSCGPTREKASYSAKAKRNSH